MSNAQFVLSYELLALLRWLVDHNDAEEVIKKMIGKALKSGLHQELALINQTEDVELLNDMQHSIADFLHLLEVLLADATAEHAKERARQQKLLPAIDQIDTSLCDDTTVRFSMEKATSEIGSNPHKNPKDVLFKELLKRWKPADKNLKN